MGREEELAPLSFDSFGQSQVFLRYSFLHMGRGGEREESKETQTWPQLAVQSSPTIGEETELALG